MEAMSTGLPCIVAKRPGVEAGVRTDFNGQLFEGGNSKDLAKKAITLLGNWNNMKTYGENSRKLALEIGDFEKNMKDIVAIYNKLATDNK